MNRTNKKRKSVCFGIVGLCVSIILMFFYASPTSAISSSHSGGPVTLEVLDGEIENNEEMQFDTIKQYRDKYVQRYTLKSSMQWYQGKQIPAQEITSVTFTNQKPATYDEEWSAGHDESKYLRGYRTGTDVIIVGDKFYLNPRSAYMFSNEAYPSLQTIKGLENIDTSECTSMRAMFQGYKGQIEGISNWDVSKVKNMELLFAGCTEVIILDIANWDVSSVKNMSAMFQSSGSHMADMKLKELDLSKWKTDSLEKLSHMFYGCANLKELNLANWDVSRVRDFSHLFADCYSLEDIRMDNWDTSLAVSFDAMFNDCHSLKVIDISMLETSSVHMFSQMFEACESLETIIGIEQLDVSSAEHYAFSEIFHHCHSLKSLDLSKWNVSKADNMARMFAHCKNLQYVNVTGWDISSVETMLEMCYGSPDVQLIGSEEWNLLGKKIEKMYQ